MFWVFWEEEKNGTKRKKAADYASEHYKINKKLDHGFCFLSFNFLVIALLETYTLKHTGNLTPQRHEDGEEDGCGVVEEVRGSGGAAGRAEPPEIAGSVTEGTHGEIETLVTHLLAEAETLRHK